MDRLPLEVRQSISEYLYATWPPALINFASASKSCHAAATKWLFRGIDFRFRTPWQFIDGIQRCSESLERNGAHKYVRELSVESEVEHEPTCFFREYEHMPAIIQHGERSLSRRWLHTWQASLDGTTVPRHKINTECTCEDYGPIYHSSKALDAAWPIFEQLISTLPALSSLRYACAVYLPPSLLEALRKYNPQCRLQVDLFQLRSCRGPARDEQLEGTRELHRDDDKLINYPTLERVSTTCGSNGQPLDNPPVRHRRSDPNVMRLLAQNSLPGLRDLRVLYNDQPDYSFNDPTTALVHNVPRHFHERQRKARLDTLHVIAGVAFVKGLLKELSSSIGFDALHTLQLSSTDKDCLLWASKSSAFQALSTLCLDTYRLWDIEDGVFWQNATAFVSSLPPLRVLSVRCPRSTGFLGPCLDVHGQSLEVLNISPSRKSPYNRYHPWRGMCRMASVDEITCISQKCSKLKHLEIDMERSNGDDDEVAVYHAIGRIPSLVSVSITFVILNTFELAQKMHGSGTHTWNTLQTHPMRTSEIESNQLRAWLVNAAVDANLARQVFTSINSTKLDGTTGLRRLDVRFMPTFDPRSHDADQLLRRLLPDEVQPLERIKIVESRLCQPWMVEKVLAGDLLALPLSRDRPISNASDTLSGDIERLFRDVWPRRSGHGDWTNDWHSFPLGAFKSHYSMSTIMRYFAWVPEEDSSTAGTDRRGRE